MVDENELLADGDRPARSTRRPPPREEADHLELWQRFWRTRDPKDREALILSYLPIVASAIARLPAELRRHWEYEDLESFGFFGLLNAIDRFQPESDPRLFPVYARKRVRGAVYDELRRLDWLPRPARSRVVAYGRAVDHLSNELGRTPLTNEVLELLGVDARHRAETLRDVQRAQLMSLQLGERSDDRPMFTELVSDREREPELVVLTASEIAEVAAAVNQLSERDRRVIELRFLRGLTQSQVASTLGLSTSRISQIESGALAILRKVLRGETEEPFDKVG